MTEPPSELPFYAPEIQRSTVCFCEFQLSIGRRASEQMEYNSIPANEKVVAEPQFFSGAMGMPK